MMHLNPLVTRSLCSSALRLARLLTPNYLNRLGVSEHLTSDIGGHPWLLTSAGYFDSHWKMALTEIHVPCCQPPSTPVTQSLNHSHLPCTADHTRLACLCRLFKPSRDAVPQRSPSHPCKHSCDTMSPLPRQVVLHTELARYVVVRASAAYKKTFAYLEEQARITGEVGGGWIAAA